MGDNEINLSGSSGFYRRDEEIKWTGFKEDFDDSGVPYGRMWSIFMMEFRFIAV